MNPANRRQTGKKKGRVSTLDIVRSLEQTLRVPTEVLFPIRLIMLDMQADEDNDRPSKQTGDGAGATGDTKGVKLLAGGRLYHTVEFLEIKTRMTPKLLNGE